MSSSFIKHKKDDTENYVDELKEEKLLKWVSNDVIGSNVVFRGPFGSRKVLYCDYTASGRCLQSIEDFVRCHVQPMYGNTHTMSSATGLQTTIFRNDARQMIRKCVNASNEDDVVIFTGSGTTSGVHKLISILGLKRSTFNTSNTVVFIGPFEHHSNILPWKEAGILVVRLLETDQGLVDIHHLKKLLIKYLARKYYMMASLSAASNVTGIFTDTNTFAQLCHKYGALSFWDYATAAPYVDIDMNPAAATNYKDAVFCSPHKFLGGPGTPGILIAKKSLFKNKIPHGCGGGTVLFVTKQNHVYLDSIEEREEGGTPAIIESIRAGLVFKLKHSITSKVIQHKEYQYFNMAVSAWKENKNILILGNTSVDRLPIFSMFVLHPESGKFLHSNFVSALLNDLFGIQSRGGCACAGPYGMDLIQLSDDNAAEFWKALKVKTDKQSKETIQELIKPGFCRLNLPAWESEDVIKLVIKAVDMVARDGWRLLPQYKADVQTGGWIHRKWTTSAKSLQEAHFGKNGLHLETHSQASPLENDSTGDYLLLKAEEIFQTAQQDAKDYNCSEDDAVILESDNLIWYLQSKEVHSHFVDQSPFKKTLSTLFFPKQYNKESTDFYSEYFKPISSVLLVRQENKRNGLHTRMSNKGKEGFLDVQQSSRLNHRVDDANWNSSGSLRKTVMSKPTKIYYHRKVLHLPPLVSQNKKRHRRSKDHNPSKFMTSSDEAWLVTLPTLDRD